MEISFFCCCCFQALKFQCRFVLMPSKVRKWVPDENLWLYSSCCCCPWNCMYEYGSGKLLYLFVVVVPEIACMNMTQESFYIFSFFNVGFRNGLQLLLTTYWAHFMVDTVILGCGKQCIDCYWHGFTTYLSVSVAHFDIKVRVLTFAGFFIFSFFGLKRPAVCTNEWLEFPHLLVFVCN